MDNYQCLVEGLPARLPPGRSRRASEKAVRDAVAQLPLANPVQAASEAEQVLDGMLATTWDGGERIAALEHLRAPVTALRAGAGQRVGAESHPLPQAASEWVTTVQRLHAKLADGYALGLHELCAPAGKLPRFKGKLAAQAAVRGLVCSTHALLWAARCYQTPRAWLWRRAHVLHAFADVLGVAGQQVADEVPDGVPCSAREAYAQMLLFAISNPYRFTAREQDEAWKVCHSLAGLATLARASQGIGVDTSADAGPGYVPEERVAADSEIVCVDMVPLERALDERVAMLPEGVKSLNLPRPGGGNVATSAPFLRRLRAGWSSAPRGHVRLGATHALDIVVGMHALHHALAGNLDFATFVRQVQDDANAAGQRDVSPAWKVASDATRPAVFRGEVLDQSEGGYRLRLPVADGLRVRIGDVLGLAPEVEDADTHDWMVGVVRWLRQQGDDLLLGIELLGREARAAGLRAITTDGAGLAPQRAVDLRDTSGQAQLSVLVDHPLPGSIAAVEVVLPRVATDWRSRPAVTRWRAGVAEPLGQACFRVTLVREEDRDS